MTIGVYTIVNNLNGKCYVGKSINIERRLTHHKSRLKSKVHHKKHVNRYLYNSVQKHGWDNFTVTIVKSFDEINEQLISECELYWIDYFNSTDTTKGYNLRRDSSTGMIVSESTRELIRQNNMGVKNPNYGNKWSEDSKQSMSLVKREQHKNGVYGDEWRKKISVKSEKFWRENPDKKLQMAKKVSLKKQKFNFYQMDNDCNLIKIWSSVEEIIKENPLWKCQQIYSVCNGHKKRIYGYKWKKVLKHEN